MRERIRVSVILYYIIIIYRYLCHHICGRNRSGPGKKNVQRAQVYGLRVREQYTVWGPIYPLPCYRCSNMYLCYKSLSWLCCLQDDEETTTTTTRRAVQWWGWASAVIPYRENTRCNILRSTRACVCIVIVGIIFKVTPRRRTEITITKSALAIAIPHKFTPNISCTSSVVHCAVYYHIRCRSIHYISEHNSIPIYLNVPTTYRYIT